MHQLRFIASKSVTVALLTLVGCATPTASESPASTPSQPAASAPSESGAYDAADLSHIVPTEAGLSDGLSLDDTTVGSDALSQPIPPGSTVPEVGFVDARLIRLGLQGPGSYWESGGYVMWAAVFETDAHAADAYGVFVDGHQSVDGWGMAPTEGFAFGEQSVRLEGAAYDIPTIRLEIWRAANLLLAAIAVGDTATGDDAQLRVIAEGMDERAASALEP